MEKKTKKKHIDYSYKNICTRIITLVYLSVILGIYPIVMDDMYFNITITRTRFFLVATILFIVCYVIGFFADLTLDKYLETDIEYSFKSKEKIISKPEFWMELFLVGNVLAWYKATENSGAFYGENGRYMGLAIYLVMGIMFMCISARINLNDIPLIIFGGVTVYIFLLGIIQHMRLDIVHYKICNKKDCIWSFLHYRQSLSDKQFDIFMSTLGNINIYASFIVISVAVFFAMFVFTDKAYMRIISGTVMVLGGSAVMIANSDSGYLGVGAAAYILLLLSYKWERFTKYTLGLFLLSIGNLLIVIMNKAVVGKYDRRGGVADALDKIGVAVTITIAATLVYFIVMYVGKKYSSFWETRNKNKDIVGIIITTVLLGIIAIIVGNKMGIGIFTFNYEWGTYRGFIWTKCMELYGELPIGNKLLGVGNDCLAEYLSGFCRQEMLDVTGKLYDNAHNELLQYLITLGLFGLITYVGLFVSSFVYIIRYGKDNACAIMSLVCMTGYFVQGLINLNQPITTPLYFVIMAVGVGYVTHLREKEERDGANC